ncbi:prolyl-tRNA synthetase [Candidatus Parcubacteria bacterium]|nr:prolyl-tRNA synthetase [Candidatus Parcubacteria bacterium]
MRQSQLFTKTRKEAPKDEVSKNAELLIRGGFIYKEMAGVYAFLPLGLRVLNKIIEIIREEMNAVGGQELSLTALQEKELWEKTDRWSDEKVDAWFKTKLKNETELGLGFTHEEPLTRLMKEYVSSYRDLPFSAYQFQTKFRNEARAKSGLMRTREFIMKDLYSFSKDKAEHDMVYEKIKQAYINIFNRLGIGGSTYVTFASGGVFSEFSHEFQTLSEAGEDIVYVDEDKRIAVNKEVYTDEVLESLGLNKSNLKERKAVETGNIFTLGTRFSEALGLTYKNEHGETTPVFMGSYGIGPARSMGTIVELYSDEAGIMWPRSVAPFRAHLLTLGEDENIKTLGDEVYKTLEAEGVEVLYDDREARAGEKFADADLIGIPTRVIIGSKTLESKMLEVKDRATGEVEHKTLAHLLQELKNG